MARMLDALRRLEAANRLVSPSAPAATAPPKVELPVAVVEADEAPLDAAESPVAVAVLETPPAKSAARTDVASSFVEIDEPPFEPTFGPLVAWERGDEHFGYHSHAIDDALDVLDALADEVAETMAPARLVTQPMPPVIDLSPLKAAAISAQTYVEPPPEAPVVELETVTSPLDEFDPSQVVREHEAETTEAVAFIGLSDAPTVAEDVLSTIQFAEQWATIALEEFGIENVGEAADLRVLDVDQLFDPPSSMSTPVVELPPVEEVYLETEPPPSAKPTAKIETNDAANRPSPSPAELAAMLDLSDAALAAQYSQLGQRIVADLTSTTKTCAALLSIEHQPHVTDVTLRTAMAICQTGKQVLVIDAALTDKQLTNGLAMPVEFGLAEVLKGRVPWQQAVRATATPGLCVLPAGRLPPPRLADDDHRLKDVLKELTSQWDLVLLDGGSLAEASARYVAAAVRNVYLVVRLGETDADAASRAAQRLDSPDIAMRGCIVTNAA